MTYDQWLTATDNGLKELNPNEELNRVYRERHLLLGIVEKLIIQNDSRDWGQLIKEANAVLRMCKGRE